MLSTQQVIQSLLDMQANAQQALPVIPNNGNPAGANNMPRNTGIVPPHMRDSQKAPPTGGALPAHQEKPSPMAERYPWLKPSQSMDNIRGYLNNRRGRFGPQPPQVPNQPALPLPQPQRPVFTGIAQTNPDDYPILLPQMPIRAEVM